jgi:hypothetical protein
MKSSLLVVFIILSSGLFGALVDYTYHGPEMEQVRGQRDKAMKAVENAIRSLDDLYAASKACMGNTEEWRRIGLECFKDIQAVRRERDACRKGRR